MTYVLQMFSEVIVSGPVDIIALFSFVEISFNIFIMKFLHHQPESDVL